MTDDMVNGVQLLLDDINTELQNKRIPRRERLLLTSNKYILESIVPLRKDVSRLKGHDVVEWGKTNPKLAIFSALGLLTLNGVINWSGIRKPLIQGIVHAATGVMLPLDSIP